MCNGQRFMAYDAEDGVRLAFENDTTSMALSEALLRGELARESLTGLMARAAALRDAGHGRVQTYSPKIFIPLTRLCRDVCHYCTFAQPPRRGERAYMTREEVLALARAGAAAGCSEALFTLGDKPELRYQAAREELAALGHATTLSYLAEMCGAVLAETGLLPHVNAGVMGGQDIAMLRRVSVSQGLMLESCSARLMEKGGPHFGSPDKAPAARLETIRLAGEALVPFTSGILIGIGETRAERLDALFALLRLHESFGHIQEIIIQNFRAKPGTKMAAAPEPGFEELLWTVAAARLIFGPAMNIQAPPNLSAAPGALIAAGINDWGGVSPVTIDHVNPEAPWPEILQLRELTAQAGKVLVPRLAVYPRIARAREVWLDAAVAPAVLRQMDADGLARAESWSPGLQAALPAYDVHAKMAVSPEISAILAGVRAGGEVCEDDIVTLFAARGPDFELVRAAADEMRAEICGETVTFAVNRNINYTNICSYKCSFCAFSKGKTAAALRGPAYDLDMAEIARRAREAWARGATEVCMQGGIHPAYTGATYLEILRTVKAAVPAMHVHAFSPLEISQGAATLNLAVPEYLFMLREAGLGSLPGTAAEILDDGMRAILCPDKLSTAGWLDVVAAAHGAGLRTTATIMFGHADAPAHWARHLLHIRKLQLRTGGFTEFVPLPFVHLEAPLYRRGAARKGPTWRETVLMHAVARLVFGRALPNIQTSWVKLGPEGAAACLRAGANDLGGTLMNESISRAAGTAHGQEMPPAAMRRLIRSAGRVPEQRTTLYGPATRERQDAAGAALPLTPPVFTAPKRVAARA
jgi:FO synthase